MHMGVLELKNLSYTYSRGQRAVLSGITLSFEAGRLYAVMGKSGSGKTTLLSLLSGLDLPTEGQILYNGRDLSQIDRDEYRARGIGVIFQGYNLLTNATALENVLLSMDISGVKGTGKKQTALELLEKVGITRDKASRKVLQLSGGEQQRVGIARALAHDPDIVLADEPTGNLDSETESAIMGIFQDLAKQQHKCVIVVTHSKNVASLADEVIQIHQINRKG